ncbi:M15 family metallopeptidase [Bacillus infantis]|uniref:M15 family metallopeptidase n=1 Tax=Bacillus infantis TaxID=324767 RepID=UPI003CF86704
MNLEQLLTKAEPKLSKIHPELQYKARELIKMAYDKGIYVIITQGLRTIAEQNALYAQGRTAPGNIVTNARGGTSYHNFGLAFDFAISNSTGSVVYWDTSIDTNKDGYKDWQQVGQMGQKLGLEWGGAWDKFLDTPHFQLTYGLSTADLRNGKKPPEFKLAVKTEEETKVDVNKLPVSPWAESAWKEAVENGYFDGTRPQANITRQEAAVLVNRLRGNFLPLVSELQKQVTELKVKSK